MNIDQYCMAKIAEEASEIAVEALKINQFGILSVNPNDPQSKTNIQRLRDELNDLMGVLEFSAEQVGFIYKPDRDAIEAKKAKLLKYMSISRELGYVAS